MCTAHCTLARLGTRSTAAALQHCCVLYARVYGGMPPPNRCTAMHLTLKSELYQVPAYTWYVAGFPATVHTNFSARQATYCNMCLVPGIIAVGCCLANLGLYLGLATRMLPQVCTSTGSMIPAGDIIGGHQKICLCCLPFIREYQRYDG